VERKRDRGPTFSLLTRLPQAERALLSGAVAVDLAVRLGVVAVAVAAADRTQGAALAGAALLAVVAAFGRWLSGVLLRRCRALLYESAMRSLLHGSVLDDDDVPEHASLLAIARSLSAGESLLATSLPGLAGDVLAAVLLGSFVAARTSWRTVALGAIGVVALVVAILVARRFAARAAAATDAAFEPVFDDLFAAHQGRFEIVAAGREGAFLDDARSRLDHWRGVAVRRDLATAAAGRAPWIAAAAAAAIALFAGDVGHEILGVAVRDALVMGAAVPAFLGLSRHVAEVARTSGQVRPLLSLWASERAGRGGGTAPLPALPAPIELRGVSFAYGDSVRPGAPVLRGCSLRWAPGELLVVRGANGAGKSTLFRVLLGLVQPQEGAVMLGGTDLFAHDLTDWRRAVAYLPQRPYFREDDDVRGAVRFLAPDADDAAIARTLESVGLLTALSRRGSDPLAARVALLSAGQRQRLALARVLCREAAVILLDEPDANLDAPGTERVIDLVRRLADGRMIAVAAHAASFAAVADVVATFAPGGSVEVLTRAGGQAALGGRRV
jgi:ABC-type multidrug transport system fused ATPase/permease subunit